MSRLINVQKRLYNGDHAQFADQLHLRLRCEQGQ
jgi:hypothetical protein